MSDLSDTIGELNKRFGKNTIISGDSLVGLDVDRVSTGSLTLDIETGGGLPYGRVVEYFGREGTGKSVMAAKTAAYVQKDGKKVVWLDVEGSFDPEWAKCLGLDVSKVQLAKTETGEQACDILDAVVRSGDCGIVVVDSTAALVPEKDLETAMGHSEQLGVRAKMVNRLIRKLHSALNMKVGEDMLPNDCLVLFINQIREKIGVLYGSPDTTPGGLGLRHAASIRIEFRRAWLKDEKDSDKIVGQAIKFKIVKNKTFPPFRRGEFDFFTDGDRKGQIDLAKEVFCYGLLEGFIENSGKTYTIGKEKFVGKPKAICALRDDDKLMNSLKVKILERIKEKTNG